MNGRWAKKIRRKTKQKMKKVLDEICGYNFFTRLRFAFTIIFALKFGVKIKNG